MSQIIKTGTKLSIEDANNLVLENQGWAESIAKSVARAWGLDWRLDGLDGAAMEALIFCARRFEPERGVPFKGYARKRIHESASEQARKSKGWQKGILGGSKDDNRARDISTELLNVYPELRLGELPMDNWDSSEGNVRAAIRQLLIGASLIATRHSIHSALPDELVDIKRVIEALSELEPVHQLLLFRVYWEGLSLRSLAAEWDTDGLNVIREHKTVVDYLHKQLSLGKQFLQRPKVRPGLKEKSNQLKKESTEGPFTQLLNGDLRS